MEMNYETLTTERLSLRKLGVKELNYLFENFNEEQIKMELGISSHESYLKEKEKYQKGYSDYRRTILGFKLIYKTTGEIIGSCGYHNWLEEHKRAEIGYDISVESLKKKGLMSEAIKEIISYGFNVMHLHRIEACARPDNIASLKLLERNNFKYEGLLRQHYFSGGIFEDSAFFSLLREEFY